MCKCYHRLACYHECYQYALICSLFAQKHVTDFPSNIKRALFIKFGIKVITVIITIGYYGIGISILGILDWVEWNWVYCYITVKNSTKLIMCRTRQQISGALVCHSIGKHNNCFDNFT